MQKQSELKLKPTRPPSPRRGPNVFDFMDYRSFLRAHFDHRKTENPNWSYGVWARLLGLKNNTSLLKVVNGTRNAGSSVQERLCTYFKFDARERAYFIDLVQLAKLRSDSPLQGALIERLAARHSAGQFHALTSEQFAVLSEWWCYAIRQLTKTYRLLHDGAAIAKHLRYAITPRQAEVAVQRMLDLGLLKAGTDGELVATEQNLRTLQDVASEAIKKFHEASFVHCHESVRGVAVEDRELSSLVFAFRTGDLAPAKQYLREMLESFDARFANSAEPDAVYQLQLALIPLTKIKDKKGKSNEA